MNCKFTLDHYVEILKKALSLNYNIFPLKSSGLLYSSDNEIVLRHDVDYSITDALRMAEVEGELGIKSTYCILLHSPTYNIGELGTAMKIREIMSIGHEIGLHYDAEYIQRIGLTLEDGIYQDINALENLLQAKVLSVSQHKPSKWGIKISENMKYIDAYGKMLFHDIMYISDSRRIWRDGCIHDKLGKENRMQLLIHPEWWERGGGLSRKATISRLAEERMAQVEDEMKTYAKSVAE